MALAGTNLDELTDPTSQDEALFAPLFDFDHAINFDFPAEQLSFDNNEFGQQDPARFPTSFAVTGAAGVLAQESADPGTFVYQLHDKPSSSPLESSASHNTAIDNLPALIEAPARRDDSNASIHCTEPECQSNFGTERELLRHQESIHSGLELPCAIPGCKRGSQKPFNRPDNLRRHMRRVHGQASQVHPVAVPESSPQGKKRQADIISQSWPVPENRRRRLEDALVHTDAQGSSQPAIDQSVELARLRRELEDAVADNQSLKEEIRSLKEEIKLRNALDECVRNRLARE
ncbi:hypothetical protein G7054_g12762 [Neopestalotiopsis clavispora]|nr:hypothetical protein G7054_g12762 [Neopestalotiopsis clavispora]